MDPNKMCSLDERNILLLSIWFALQYTSSLMLWNSFFIWNYIILLLLLWFVVLKTKCCHIKFPLLFLYKMFVPPIAVKLVTSWATEIKLSRALIKLTFRLWESHFPMHILTVGLCFSLSFEETSDARSSSLKSSLKNNSV